VRSDDREAETDSGDRLLDGARGPQEAVEELRLLGLRHADAGVGHLEQRPSVDR
jgi:hypothetical protein